MALEGVKQCCQSLKSEKVTERKNGSEKLRSLLNNSTIVTSLNGRTAADSFNWSQVFLSGRKYFLIEARKLEDEERSKPNVSQTVLRNRENHKRTAASLPLLILKKACRATPHVHPQPLIELVLKVLNKREPYLIENFAGEFLQMTLKFVLRYRQYYSEMTNLNWKELLKICVWLYEKSVPNSDPQSIFLVMVGVVRHCQTKMVPHRGVPTRLEVLCHLPNFLRKALLSERLMAQLSLRSSLLKLLLEFTSMMALEWRVLLCGLGEDTFDAVLGMWDERPSTRQTHWIHYMTLLLVLHHPLKDGKVKEGSQYSVDAVRWERCLRHLYQLLHDHLARRGTRALTGSGGSGGGAVLSGPLLTLATRVCLQVFSGTESTGFIDVTQVASTSSGGGGGSNKRRKIEVGLMPLVDLLKAEGTLPHTLPWYEILLCLLTHHPHFLGEGGCVLVVHTLQQVLAAATHKHLQDMAIRCLTSLAKQYSVLVSTKGDRDEHSGDDLWPAVWDLTLRLVSGRYENSSGLNLMGTLIETGLVIPDSSAFKLFHQNYLGTNEAALRTLLGLLTTVPLPRHFENEPTWLQKSQGKEARERLILYCLSTQDGGGGMEGGGGIGKPGLGCLENPALLATVLGCLCVREPHCAKIPFHHHHHHHNNNNINSHNALIAKMEKIYHLSTFTYDLPAHTQVTQVNPDDPAMTLNPRGGAGAGGGGAGRGGGGEKHKCVLPEKLEFMIREVLAFCDKVEAEDSTNTQQHLQRLISLAHLLVCLYIENGEPRLERKFRSTLRLVSVALERECVGGGVSQWQTLHPLLMCLMEVFGKEQQQEEAEGEVSSGRHQQLLSATPTALFAVLLSLLEKRCAKTAAAAGNTQLTRGNSFNQSSFDDLDFEFDDTLPSSSAAIREEILDFEDDLSNQADEEQTDEHIIVDNHSTLSLRDQCVVLAGQCVVCAAAATPPGAGDAQHSFLHKAVDVMLQLSLNTALEMSDVAVVLAFVQSLFVSEYSEDNILDGLEVTSNVAKLYCSVTQVARCALNNLAALVQKHGRHLSPDIGSSILTLVKAFAIKHHQGNYDRTVTKAIFDVNVQLTKIDPKRSWSHYSIPEHDRCSKTLDLLCNDSNELRLLAAAATPLLLVSGGGGGGGGSSCGGSSGGGGGGELLDTHHQDRVFEEAYQIVLESLNLPDLPMGETATDEKGNRIASFLLTLGSIVMSSPYLESKALFALCLSVPVYKIDPALLLQLMKSIARARHTTTNAVLSTNLQYLASQWLQHNYSITAFPSTAFGITADTFLSAHRSCLVPVLFECDQREAVEGVAGCCGKDVKGVVSEVFPVLMARVFPYIAAEEGMCEARLAEAKIQAGKRQYKHIERTLGTDTFTAMLTGHIGAITLHLLQLAHDPRPWVEEEVVVPPPPPSFTPDVILATLKFVGGIFRQDGLLLVFLGGRRKELHKVVVGLLQHLGRTTCPHTARQAITAAATLVEATLPHLATHLSQVAHYLLRMLVHLLSCRLVHLARLGPHLAHRCLALLQQVVQAALHTLPSHLVPALPSLFGRLLPLLARPQGVGGTGPARVLGLLLDSDDPELKAALAILPALPPLPDNPDLAGLREKHRGVVTACRGQPDLLDEVDNFLATSQDTVATHHLTHLTTLLRTVQGQVSELFAGAVPGRESRGHRLAHNLVSLAAGGRQDVALEACECLGELGPLSLASPVFLTSEGDPPQPQGKGEVDLEYVGRILLALNGYLTCGDVEVEEAASQAMMGVLATQHGHAALQALPHTTKEELRPLMPEGRPKAGAEGDVDGAAYQQIVGDEQVWLVGEDGGYEGWVCGVARTLIMAGCGTEVAAPLLPVCALKPEFSALALPFLVHMALATDTGCRRDVLSRQVSAFFARHSQGGHHTAPGGARHSRAAVQAMLVVVDYLRLHQPHRPLQGRRPATPFDNNLWLNINYLEVAGAAHHCGAHFSALLYLQLHHTQMMLHTPTEKGRPAITRRLQAPPTARVSAHPEAVAAGRLLMRVYGALGDGAGVEGCIAAGVVLDTPARLMMCQHRGEWLAALAVCDASHHWPGLLDTLAAFGLYHTLGGVVAGRDNTQGVPGEGGRARWESAWRLCRWEEEGWQGQAGTGGRAGEEGKVHQHVFEALRSLHHLDLPGLHQHTTKARTTITHTLNMNRAESTSLINPILTQLQILNEIEQAGRCLTDLTSPEKVRRCLHDLENRWQVKEEAGSVCYKYKEEMMAGRVSVLKALCGSCKEEEDTLQAMLHRTLLAKSKLARLAAKEKASVSVVASESAILWASKLAVSPELANLTRLEEAEVARAAGDVQRARHSLQALLRDMEGQEGREQERIKSQVLTLLGELLMDTRCLPPHTVIQEYFNRATTTLLHHDATDQRSQEIVETSHQRLAMYVDQLYQQVHNHLESDASQTKRSTIQRSGEELQRLNNLVKDCREMSNDWKELTKKIVLLERNINIDCAFLTELEKEENTYLLIALKSYLTCLAMTSKHDLHTYRVVSLWLQNCAKDEVNSMVSEFSTKVKSCHYVPVLYQLVARLTTHHSHQPLTFPSVLSHLLMRVCMDHPHHTLPVIYALAHAHADDQFIRTHQKTGTEITVEDRVQAAKRLVDTLKKTPTLTSHVLEFEKTSLAYLSLANWCGAMGRLQAGTKVEIPHSQPLRNLSSLHHTTAFTQPLKLQPSAQYNPPLILDWEGTGMCVGGVNSPIRLTVKMSDGAKHFELLKGKDDVRQDAVMEQVFGIVNELLMRSSETRDSGLSVRTYQVVPLSQRSGLIQWCRNTQSFGKYLIEADKKSGAHKVYYPKDYPARTCMEKLQKVKGKSAQDKLRVFVDILENFHPVFHNFFLESYRSPHAWHQHRLAYTKSVATTSIVGYILGLGDRHPENILLDKTTAELIHIDLGIAFELGKVLPTPETVPFRMTQDMVAGLGVLGVEGPLRGWCEATLRVLRGGGEVLVTLVEVLRHDPLHQWTLTPQQVAKLQATGDEEESLAGIQSSVSMAERVVLKVRQKLVGMEEGFPSSVPDQVTRLLQDATNLDNLSRLFAGWQAYV